MKTINYELLNKRSDPNKKKISKISSNITKIVLETMHGDFATICSNFSVINCLLSSDMRYIDIFILPNHNIENTNEEELLNSLNYDENKRTISQFSKISLKYQLSYKVSKIMKLRYTPKIKFKIADEIQKYVNFKSL